MKYFGAAYYPEVHEESEWVRDIKLMHAAHINVVRLGESSWQAVQPSEGSFKFDWLLRAVDLFSTFNIKVILSTPTYIPPIWLTRKYPDILLTKQNGLPAAPGARHHYCLNSRKYITATELLVSNMAKYFSKKENVIGWQIHNELGLTSCYCDSCRTSWHRWLERRYHSINNLNTCWGTTWSRTYTAFNDIPTPIEENGEGGHVLSLTLDYKRYKSDTIITYSDNQARVIRKFDINKWITHNTASGLFSEYDSRKMYKKLDIAGWDNYPDLQGGWRYAAISHRLFYSHKNQAHWALEHVCGRIGNHESASPSPLYGQITKWVWHSYASGCDGIVFWLWRSFPSGNWPFWQGILLPNSKLTERYKEIKALGNEISKLRKFLVKSPADVVTKNVIKRIALIIEYDDTWILDYEKGDRKFNAVDAILNLYGAIARFGFKVDVVSANDSFDNYDIVFVSNVIIQRPALFDSLKHYANNGGTVIIGPRSDWSTSNGTLVCDRSSEKSLSALAGIEIDDYDTIESIFKINNSKHILNARYWIDLATCKQAKQLAYIHCGRYKHRPLLTENKLLSGSVFYITAYPDETAWYYLISKIIKIRNINTDWNLPEDCEVIHRKNYMFLFNHSASNQVVKLPRVFKDLRNNKLRSGKCLIKTDTVLILK